VEKIKIGLVSFFHNNARGDFEVFEKAVRGLEELSKSLNFELFLSKTKVYTYEDAEKAVAELNSQGLAFCLLFCASVANGEAVVPFRSLNCRIGIWSVPETTQSGYLPINSFCGSMILSGILGQYLKNSNIKFKWFYGYPDQPLFLDRFRVTVKAIRAIESLNHAKLGLIGPTVRGFDHLIVNNADLLQKYGVFVDRFISLEDIVERTNKVSAAEVDEEIREMLNGAKLSKNVSKEELEKSARLKISIAGFTKENDFDILAISCWTKLQELYGAAACSSISQLNNQGIATACEGDVDGALGMFIASCFSDEPSTMVDIVNFDEADNSMNLWHCGPSPKCFANEEGVNWDHHFDIGENVNGEWHGCGTVASFQFKPGKITVHRLSSRTNEMLVLTGDIIQKETYQGSSGWVGNVTIKERRLSVPEIITLLLESHADHHVVFGYGNYDAEFREFAFWKDVNVLEHKAYYPYSE
jgi:L-fucose isomerase-like protein